MAMSKHKAGLRAIDCLHDQRVPVETRQHFYGDVMEALMDSIHAAANRLSQPARDDDDEREEP